MCIDLIKMIKIRIFFILAFLSLVNSLFSQAAPQDLTIIEDNISESNEIDSEIITDADGQGLYLFQPPKKQSNIANEEDLTEIIIDDIPQQFNDWYGLLSSEEGGLGWLMWGSTSYKDALKLLRNLDLSIESPTLRQLFINTLLSRAQSPRKEKVVGIIKSEQNKQFINKPSLIFFEEKVRILSRLGMSNYIKSVSENIPLEIKKTGFEKYIKKIRYENFDIPFICNDIKNRLYEEKEKLSNRKILISCKVGTNQIDEAMLALELLENDNKASDNFINFSRDFIDNNNYDFMSPLFENKEDQILLNIMAMKDIKIAKKIIVNNKVNLDKIIYDLKLYLKENQIESLERLVTRGIYEPNLLVKEYLSFNNNKNGLSTTNILDLNNNSAEIRARLFQLAYNAEDESDRAKYLNRLWKKAENIGVYLGVSKASKDMAISINPNEKYIWTLYPMVKALLTNNKLEEAKKWLFLIPDNIKNRSALDINFSKILLLMYIKDKNFLNQDENLPDVSYLLEILLNDIDLDRTKILNATLTMKALNYNLPQGIWKKFEKVTSEGKANIVEKFILRETISSNNRAEAIFKILNMLYDKKISKNYSYDAIFSTITSLYDLGLEDYARDFAFELNLGLAN